MATERKRLTMIKVEQVPGGARFRVVNDQGAFIRPELDLTLHYERCHADMRSYAEFHGWKQRIVDKAALGAEATLEQKFVRMGELIQHFESGTDSWDMGRGGFQRDPNIRLLVRTLMIFGAKDEAKVQAFVEAKSREERKAILTMPRYKEAVDLARAEEVTKSGVDVTGLEDELDSL